VRARGWRGYYVGRHGAGHDAFASALADAFTAVWRRVNADFALNNRRPRTISVLCYADTHGYEQAVRLFGERLLRSGDYTPLGLYLAQIRAVLVFLSPFVPDFRFALAHELAHALCDLLVRKRSGRPPAWAEEGYAHLIESACGTDSSDLQRRYLAYFSYCYGHGLALRLRELLTAVDRHDKLEDCNRLHTEAAVFVGFLNSVRPARPQVWVVLRAALAGSLRCREEAIAMFEQAFEAPIEMIEAQFIDYCIDEAKRLKAEPTDRPVRLPRAFYGPKRN